MQKPDEAKCAACSLGPPDWEYICHECGRDFTLPAPSGPTEERRRTCPECESSDIERVNIVKSEACPPGG